PHAMPGPVHVIGSLMVDRVLRVATLPRAGETITARSATIHPGGKGANQAVAAARCGARVRMLGRTGADGRFIVDELVHAGVDAAAITTDDPMSGSAAVMVDDHGMNAIVIAPEANTRGAAPGGILLVQNECSGLAHAAATANRHGLRVWLNAAPMDDRVRGVDLSLVDCLLVNETEAMALAAIDDPHDAFAGLCDAWPKLDVVLTLGAAGWIARVDGTVLRGAALPVRVIDTVGCGDAFVGALAALRSEGMAWPDALARANAAGAIAATVSGAIPSIPSREAIEAMVRSLGAGAPTT
ncbi:MAG: Bifunctional ribokinase/ribose-5-phosphate isomerase, partial [Planctomycetota bacterium]